MSYKYSENTLTHSQQEYYGVRYVSKGSYQAEVNVRGHYWKSKRFRNERDAAIAYDKKMIELGLKPMNILKKKK